MTAKAFIESDGTIELAAAKFLGATNRRQSVAIYKRANAATPASVDTKCRAGSCQDISLEVTALHSVNGKTAESVIDLISAAKLSSIKPAVVSYTAREVAASPLGTIDNTSVYKVTPFQICGHQAFLMTGISTRDQNSFMNASSDVLAVEAGSRVLTIAVA